MLKTSLLYLLFCVSVKLTAQVPTGPEIAWQKCYGGSENDFFHDVITTSDGGFLASLYTVSHDGDLEGVEFPFGWVIKFDSVFNIEWQNHYGFGAMDCFLAPFKLSEVNGFYFLSGVGGYEACEGAWGSNDFQLMKTDINGEIIWQHNYGSPGYETFNDMLPIEGGGFLITGQSSGTGGDIPFNYSGDGATHDVIVIRTDSSGNLLWLKVLGGTASDDAIGDVLEMKRGYYTLNIVSYSNDHDLAGSGIEGRKRWIVKLDSLGNIADENIISGDEDLYSYGGHEIMASGNKMLLADEANSDTELFPGITGYGQGDGAIAVFDSELNFTDLKIYGGSHQDLLYRIEKIFPEIITCWEQAARPITICLEIIMMAIHLIIG